MTKEEKFNLAKDWYDSPDATEEERAHLEAIFAELKDGKDEKIRKELIKMVEIRANSCDVDRFVSWIERQGCPKHSDNIGPKFKAGDWVIHKETGIVHQIKQCVEMGTTNTYGYDLVGGEYISTSNSDKYRLWSIGDAKDGDVLVSEYGNPFIFSGEVSKQSVGAYGGISTSKQFEASYTIDDWTTADWTSLNVSPATKKQRDLLFSKMKEAGYKWDPKKKELKKIEQEAACNADEFPYNNPSDHTPVTVIERDGEQWVRVCALGEDFLIAAHNYKEGEKTEFTWEESRKIGTFSKKQAYIMLALLDEINAILEEIGGEPLASGYWSSSEYNQYYAWNVYFYSGDVYSINKFYLFVARKVTAF